MSSLGDTDEVGSVVRAAFVCYPTMLWEMIYLHHKVIKLEKTEIKTIRSDEIVFVFSCSSSGLILGNV